MKIVTKENQDGVDYFYHVYLKYADKQKAIMVRRMGKTKTWKTFPDKFQIPVKFGLRESFYITEENAPEWSVIDPTGLILTAPQKKIYARLLDGEKVTNIHTHRQSGGDFVWVKEICHEGVFYKEYEKTVWHHEFVGYRAFWNLMRALKKDSDASEYFHIFDIERSTK